MRYRVVVLVSGLFLLILTALAPARADDPEFPTYNEGWTAGWEQGTIRSTGEDIPPIAPVPDLEPLPTLQGTQDPGLRGFMDGYDRARRADNEASLRAPTEDEW